MVAKLLPILPPLPPLHLPITTYLLLLPPPKLGKVAQATSHFCPDRADTTQAP
jgi:hypothetical protein